VEVEGVGGAEDNDLSVGLGAAELAEALDGFGEGELLAGEAVDEAAAADSRRGLRGGGRRGPGRATARRSTRASEGGGRRRRSGARGHGPAAR